MESLDKYLSERLTVVGKASYESIKETITSEANQVFEDIKNTTPVKTGGLKNSLTIEEVKDDKNSRYGYTIFYDGYNQQGTPYSKIGATLNKGTSKIPATRHIDKAVKKLKGLDDRIAEKFKEKVGG